MIEPQDVYEFTYKQNSKNMYDTLMDIKEFLATMRDNKQRDQFLNDLEMYTNGEAIIEGTCPECGDELQYSKQSDGIVEYCGTRCRTEITVAQCYNCGYVVGE